MRVTEQWLTDYQARQASAATRGNQVIPVPNGRGALLEVPKRVRVAKRYSEDAIQIALIEWTELVTVGPYLLSQLLYAVPNGGYRTSFEAAKFKRLGVRAGVPDLELPVPAGRWHGGYWELKAGKNKPTAEQVGWHERLRFFGYYVNTCWQWEEAAADIKRYLTQGSWTVVDRARLST